MFTYAVQYIKMNLLSKHIQVIYSFMFNFNYFLVFQNSISKTNEIPKTILTCQWLLYAICYSIIVLDLIYTVKVWHQTTETINIQCTLTIFNHWGINVKLHFLHVFGISDWNYKHFKWILVLYFIMSLKYFFIEISFTCADFFFNSIRINTKTMLWYFRPNLELEFIFILILILIFFSDLRTVTTDHEHECI